MAEAKSAQLWDHTTSIMAVVINFARGFAGKEGIDPASLHPHRKPAKIEPPTPEESRLGFEVLKSIVTGGKFRGE